MAGLVVRITWVGDLKLIRQLIRGVGVVGCELGLRARRVGVTWDLACRELIRQLGEPCREWLRADRWVLTNQSSAALRLAKWLLTVVRMERDMGLIRYMRMLIRGKGVNGKSRVCLACGTALKRVAESRIGKSAPKAPFRLGGRAGQRD